MNELILKKLQDIAEEFGASEFDATIQALEDFEPEPGDTGGSPCPSGYVWSTKLKKCVADIG